jgi:hypothetical protein
MLYIVGIALLQGLGADGILAVQGYVSDGMVAAEDLKATELGYNLTYNNSIPFVTGMFTFTITVSKHTWLLLQDTDSHLLPLVVAPGVTDCYKFSSNLLPHMYAG